MYRISRGYDLWRAKALVESSRRYSLAARRATEARYVVDLSELDKDEAFVASPKVWADEIYGYDLAGRTTKVTIREDEGSVDPYGVTHAYAICARNRGEARRVRHAAPHPDAALDQSPHRGGTHVSAGADDQDGALHGRFAFT